MSIRLTTGFALAAITLAVTGCSVSASESPAFVSSFAAKAVADELVDDGIRAADAARTDPTSVSLLNGVVTDNLGELDPSEQDVPVVTGIADDDGDGLDDDRRFQVNVGEHAACATIDAAGDGKVASGSC